MQKVLKNGLVSEKKLLWNFTLFFSLTYNIESRVHSTYAHLSSFIFDQAYKYLMSLQRLNNIVILFNSMWSFSTIDW